MSGYDFDWHMHIFVVIHWCGEVEKFEIGGDIMRVWHADYVVPHDFQHDKVRSVSGKFIRVIDEVTTNGDADSIGIFILQMVVDNDSGVGSCAVSGMFLISSCAMKNIALVPAAKVFLSP